MAVCSECATSVPTGAGWCGWCGALAAGTLGRADDAPADAGAGSGSTAEQTGGWREHGSVDTTGPPTARTAAARARAGASVAIIAAVGIGLATIAAPSPRPTAAPTGPPPTSSAPTASAVPSSGQLWRADGAVSAVVTGPVVVRPAGDQHVVVGRDVVATGTATSATGRRLPAGLVDVAVDADGRWAVAEDGRVAVGRVDRDSLRRVRVGGRWRPDGPAVAWTEDGVVMRGSGGLLGLVTDDGDVGWTTDVPVDPSVAGPGLAVGLTPAGAGVVVDLTTGGVAAMPPEVRAAAIGVDTVLTVAPGDRVAIVGMDGQVRGGGLVPGAGSGRWDSTASGFVLTTPTAATLVDPRSGATIATIAERSPVAVADGVVVGDGSDLALRRWDGRAGWERPRSDQTGQLRRIDDHRLSLTSRTSGAVRASTTEDDGVEILAAADGGTLASTVPTVLVPRRWRSIVGAVDDLVAVTGGTLVGTAGVGWIDARSGRSDEQQAAALLGGVDGGWRFAGWLEADGNGPPAPVRTRRQGDSVVVRVGGSDPIAVDVDPHGLGIGRPVLGVGTLAFSALTPDKGLVLVDAETGATASVAGLSPRLVAGTTQMAVADADPAHDPFGRQPVDLVALEPSTGAERWRHPAMTTVGVFGDGPELVSVTASTAGPVLVEAGSTMVRGTTVADGSTLWSDHPRAPLATVPVVAGDVVAVPLVDGSVVALDAATGHLRWSVDTGVVTAASAQADGFLFGTMDGGVVTLDVEGRLTSTLRVADEPVHDVAWIDDVVIAAAGSTLVGVAPPVAGQPSIVPAQR